MDSQQVPSTTETGSEHTTILEQLLNAQTASALLLSASRIKDSALALVEFARSVGAPILMPVSPMADRLVGAALLMSEGTLSAVDDNFVATGKDVLLVEVVAVQATALRHHQALLASLGAKSVQAVALGFVGGQVEGIGVLSGGEVITPDLAAHLESLD